MAQPVTQRRAGGNHERECSGGVEWSDVPAHNVLKGFKSDGDIWLGSGWAKVE